MIAAIYARVSSADQAGAEKISITEQISRCRAAAEEEGFSVPDEFVFTDAGESGTLDENERQAFGEVLSAATSNKYQKLFFWKIDRFARSAAVALNGFQSLTKAGVEFRSVGEPGAETNPFMRTLFAGMAEFEHASIKQRTVPARRHRRDQGYWGGGSVPFGYVEAPGGTLKQCEYEAPVLRRIFKLCETEGTTNIAKRLNAEGVPPTFAMIKHTDGSKKRFRIRSMDHLLDHLERTQGKLIKQPTWTGGSIRQILANPVCYGELHITEVDGKTKTGTRPVYNGDGSRKVVPLRIDDGPIVSRKEFEMLAKKRSPRKFTGSGRKRNFLLTGLLKCHNHACRSAYKHQGSITRPWNYYGCDRRMDAGNCSNWNVRAREANYIVTRELADFLMEHLHAEKIIELIIGAPQRREEAINTDRAEVAREKRELSQRRSALARRLMALGIDETYAPEFTDELKHLKTKIDQLEERETELAREKALLLETLTLSRREAEKQAERAMVELAKWDKHIFAWTTAMHEAPKHLIDVANAAIDHVEVISLRGYPDRNYNERARRTGEHLEDYTFNIQFKEPDECIPEIVRILANLDLLEDNQSDANEKLHLPIEFIQAC